MDSPNSFLPGQVGLVHVMRPNRTHSWGSFFIEASKTTMETLETLSKVYGEYTMARSKSSFQDSNSIQRLVPRFTKGIGVLKRAENLLNTRNALDELRLHGTRKKLRWGLNVFKKIVAKHLNEPLKHHTSRRLRVS
ncbi:hypothetical protein TNCV_4789661 [Trichonephila clavipes]|nr:hypothetical protein TNCV_4789661 [Trichonephila clavipes]